MKANHYQQLWNDVTTGQTYVIKSGKEGEPLEKIKTDPSGNSRHVEISGPRKNAWDAGCNFYRPLTAKLDGYSQMPRPKVIAIATNWQPTQSKDENQTARIEPIRVRPCSGIEQIKKAYGFALPIRKQPLSRNAQIAIRTEVSINDKTSQSIGDYYQIDQSTRADTQRNLESDDNKSVKYSLKRPTRVQSAKIERNDLKLISQSLEVGRADKERNEILLQTKTFCPDSQVQVPVSQKKRIWSAMPGGNTNRQLHPSSSDFKGQKILQQSISNFSIKQKHEELVKGFMSDRRFELITKIPAKLSETIESDQSRLPAGGHLSSRTDKSNKSNQEPQTVQFTCQQVIEDYSDPQDRNSWAHKGGLQTKSKLVVQYQKHLKDSVRIDLESRFNESCEVKKTRTKNYFGGVDILTTRAHYQNDVAWIKASCPEVFARRENECISEFRKQVAKKEFKQLIQNDVMKKANKRIKVAFYA